MSLAHILGEPRKGFHEKRIPYVDLAFNDTVGTLFIAFLLSFTGIMKSVKGTVKRTVYFFVILFVIGEVLHILFGVETEFVKKLKSLLC